MLNKATLVLGALVLVGGVTSNAHAYFEHTQVDEIVIDSNVFNVYSYATTAENWVDWHPNTVATEGADWHSARVGEEIIEHVSDPSGAAATIHWTVTEARTARRWRIEGVSGDGIWDFSITYDFTPQRGGRTLWTRTLVFGTAAPFPAPQLAFLVQYMDTVSGIAVANFKAVLESLPMPWWLGCDD